ncbi:MAG TPA: calcineurin-like phosphoesterase family protein [Opitutaceae bacterium]|nr:calcineurin-like phosphoesterase family protein [Opitutaceae bacterium]
MFDDRNANGVRDPGEPGLTAVAVSNGTEVVLTNAEGRYELPADGDAALFVIKPRNWRPPVDAQNLPQFYRRIPAGASSTTVDFPLIASDEADAFRMAVFTDPQPYAPEDVDHLNRTIVDGLVGRRDLAFGVTLGDVTNDRFDLYPAVTAAIGRIGVPWYHLSGNHDLNLDTPDDRHEFASFEAAYGPSTYAFHHGRVLFVALNDVRFLGGLRYVGGLRDDQFAFLGNLLRVTPRDELVVLMMHIPFFFPNPANAETFRAADRARLFALLQDRPNNFWLSGHTHYQRHVFYGPADGWRGAQPLHDYNVAAASGSFWGGPPDASGIPIATMWDGTPHGYAILGFNGTAQPDIEYRAARQRPDFQVGVYAPDTVAPHLGYVSFFANVFNGHDGWKVEARVDDRAWTDMRRILEWDPAYAKLYLAQDSLAVPLRGRRLPDPTVCYHLWRNYLPADLAVGTHTLEVRATDPQGKAFSSRRGFRVVEPAP